MPDVVLQELAELLAHMQYHATPPLQVMTNIMTMLPKKDGGTRTVAIAATLYRLLMELDNAEVEQFESREAFENDSAKAGASAVRAAEDRALEAEIAKLEGSNLLTILWDLKKCFDTINIFCLFQEAVKLEFPLRQFVLSIIVHHSPRRLKHGNAVGEAIVKLGRSILAGCKRSTHLARVYTLTMVRDLAAKHKSIQLFQHVDDMSNIVVSGFPVS
jgi:hypothetical protein